MIRAPLVHQKVQFGSSITPSYETNLKATTLISQTPFVG
jgi:hypothetical protein